jgi:hypothetical protein
MSFRLTDLDDTLQPLYTRWQIECANQNLVVRGIQGWRDPAYQDQLHAQGISPLTGASSLHCCVDANGNPASKAFDFGVFDGGAYITNGQNQRYTQAGEIWKSLGQIWGGDFIHPGPDWDHCQLAGITT